MSDELNQLNELEAALHNAEQLAAIFSPGQIIGGRYKILSLLGRGGVGCVYLVEQVFLKQELALKVLDGKQILNDAQVRRFQIEAKAAHSLNHPSLVMVHDFGVLENEQPYLVMEYIKGVNLTDFIKANGTLSPQLTTLIFAQLSMGMAHAHQKSVIHRDIKPSNIMLSESLIPGTPGSAKIVDFGIAKLAFDESGEIQSLTRTGEIFGSPLYMSPEQCSGGAIDHRSDIYSFGCAMFEALTGTPPHLGTNPLRTMMLHVNEPAPLLREASLGKQFPAELEKIVEKLLKKAPSERYQNFDDVANDLASIYSKGVAVTAQNEIKVVRESRKVNITWKRLSLYIALAMTASSALTAVIIQTAKVSVSRNESAQTSSSPAPETSSAIPPSQPSMDQIPEPEDPMEDAIDGNTAAKTAFAKVSRISSVIVLSGDHKGQRQFDFPGVSLGYVIYGANSRHSAIGTQYFPAGIPLTLSVGGSNPEAFNRPEIFTKLNSNDFKVLKIAPPSTAVVVGTPTFSVEKEAENLARILAAFSKSESLNSVSIHLFALNRETISALDHMIGLRSLDLFGTLAIDLTEDKHPAFHRITNLCLTRAQHPDLIFRQIEGSRELTSLAVQDCSPLSADFLSGLHSCSKLNYLAVENDVFSSRWLKDLRLLSSLRTLYLKELVITPQQLQKILDSCPQIEKVILAGNSAKSLFQSGEFKRNARVFFQGFQ
ncbi:hypothetical protein BH10CYA1_BH10CYA1_32240 [soil metagenome]